MRPFLKAGAMQNDGFVHLLISLWDHPDPRRMEELITCLRRNIANPNIYRIHVFYESKTGAWNDVLIDEKISVILIKEYPTYKMFIDHANRYLRGKIVAIANADIFFDGSLDLLRGYDMAGKCLALTRYNEAPYKSWRGSIWERNCGSQDAWIFHSPLPDGFYDIRIGYLGCDSWVAWEMDRVGIAVSNPSMDIKAWHLHAERDMIVDKLSDDRSYHSIILEKETGKPLKHKMVPIEPLGRWKVYTVYSPSHEVLYNKWFLGTMKDDFDVISRCLEQSCEKAEFYTNGWVETVFNKIPVILGAIDSTPENGLFIFSDVDIQFFSPIKEDLLKILSDLPNTDMFFQQDAIKESTGIPNYCTGFFLCKSNSRTRKFWELVGERMKKEGRGDQDSVNYLLKAKVVPGLKVDFLPLKFWATNSGFAYSRRWEPGFYLDIPQDILMHHANWTVGNKNKIEQMEYVSRKKSLLDFKKKYFGSEKKRCYANLRQQSVKKV